MSTFSNTQEAPFPTELQELLVNLEYKPQWRFSLKHLDRGQGSVGLTLIIDITTPNSYNHAEIRRVLHYFPVIPAAYNEQSWRRWLFERILEVERHEAAEFFTIKGDKPFAPRHGPGNDPYVIVEYADEIERRTSFRGEVYE